jgi:hypothetical protein
MDLGRCGSGESLVWAKPEVVEKGECQPAFEITPEESVTGCGSGRDIVPRI